MPRPKDKAEIGKLILPYSEHKEDEIVDLYKSEVNTNIVDSHSQDIHRIALNIVSKGVIGKSPICIENNCLISMDAINCFTNSIVQSSELVAYYV